MLTALRFGLLALTILATVGVVQLFRPFIEGGAEWIGSVGGAYGAGSALLIVLGCAALLARYLLRREDRLHYQRTGEILVRPKARPADPAQILGRIIIGGLMLFGLIVAAMNGFQ